MSNTLESTQAVPDSSAPRHDPSESACRRAAILRAAIAEGLWTSLFAVLPFAGERLAEVYVDKGAELPQATLGVLRFARAMHPTPHLIPYIALIFGVGIVCGWLILAAAAGSTQVRQASKFAATIMLAAAIITWLAVAAALLVPYFLK